MKRLYRKLFIISITGMFKGKKKRVEKSKIKTKASI